jgi:hypothetical protein
MGPKKSNVLLSTQRSEGKGRQHLDESALIDNEILENEWDDGISLDAAVAKGMKRSIRLEDTWDDLCLIGAICAVFWEDDNKWYYGRLLHESVDLSKIFVLYDDCMTEWVDCNTEKVKISVGVCVFDNWAAHQFWLSESSKRYLNLNDDKILLEYIQEKKTQCSYVKSSQITSIFSVTKPSKVKNWSLGLKAVEGKRTFMQV